MLPSPPKHEVFWESPSRTASSSAWAQNPLPLVLLGISSCSSCWGRNLISTHLKRAIFPDRGELFLAKKITQLNFREFPKATAAAVHMEIVEEKGLDGESGWGPGPKLARLSLLPMPLEVRWCLMVPVGKAQEWAQLDFCFLNSSLFDIKSAYTFCTVTKKKGGTSPPSCVHWPVVLNCSVSIVSPFMYILTMFPFNKKLGKWCDNHTVYLRSYLSSSSPTPLSRPWRVGAVGQRAAWSPFHWSVAFINRKTHKTYLQVVKLRF